MTAIVELVASGADEGARLDVALAARPEVGSRAAAQRLIDDGRVTVNGEPRPKRHRLRSGDRVVADLARPAAPDAADTRLPPEAIAYEDEHLLVVDKPAGLVVHPAPGHRGETLVEMLSGRAAGGDESWRPGVVHRLDRDTSGLLVLAKSDAAHRALQASIRSRAMRREYLALVEDGLESRSGTIDAPLGRDRTRRSLVSTRTDRPRAARTHFQVVEVLPRSTLVEARLETGRTHQVRAHFAAIGRPVLGDPAYGADARERLGLARQFLHSARLAFPHPVGGRPVECESPLPVDLDRALAAARSEPPPA